MNAPFLRPLIELEQRAAFDTLRLEILDAFYELDVVLEDWIHDGGGAAAGASTGCRLKKLCETSFEKGIATTRQTNHFAGFAKELEPAIRLRNVIVHSHAGFGTKNGHPIIFLSPVSHELRAGHYFSTTDVASIKTMVRTVASVTSKLVAWRNQRIEKPATSSEPIENCT